MSRLRAPIAWAVVVVSVATLLVAFAVARARHVYLGGLTWPFLSDLGRGATSSVLCYDCCIAGSVR